MLEMKVSLNEMSLRDNVIFKGSDFIIMYLLIIAHWTLRMKQISPHIHCHNGQLQVMQLLQYMKLSFAIFFLHFFLLWPCLARHWVSDNYDI